MVDKNWFISEKGKTSPQFQIFYEYFSAILAK